MRILGFLAVLFLAGCPTEDGGGALLSPDLSSVTTWAYQLQGLEQGGAIDALVESTYDLVVLEPSRTVQGASDFDTAGMVARLKNSTGRDGRTRKMVIAYIDIGQAENWRWYWTWSTDWPAGEPRPADWPDWIVGVDPAGWAGDFTVAFWDPAWKDIMMTGANHPATADRDYVSMLDEVIRDGFDGVYLDWVEAYADDAVIQAAEQDGVDPVEEMVRFIGGIRAYGRQRNPDFIVIQQNSASLIEEDPAILDVVDAIGQEDTWFGGEANAEWDDPAGYGQAQTAEDTAETQRLLALYQAAGKKVFTIDYTVDQAAEVYAESAARGWVPYCTRTSLDRLTTTPPP